MENKAFDPDEEQTPKDEENQITTSNSHLGIENLSPEVAPSPPVQEIVALVHPEPPEIHQTHGNKPITDTSNTDEGKTTENMKSSKEVKGDNEIIRGTESFEVLDEHEPSEGSSQNNLGMDGNYNEVLHTENGYIKNSHYCQISDGRTTEIAGLTTSQSKIEFAQKGDIQTLQNENPNMDIVVAVSETEVGNSKSKSFWYYIFLLLLLVGFLVALAIGLIFGRD